MELKIIRPSGSEQFDVVTVELNTPEGNIVILKEHVPMIVTLTQGKEIGFILKSGKRESVLVRQGIAHITRTNVTVMLNEKK